MLKGISKWKRLLAIVMLVAMLFTSDYGLLHAFAVEANQGGVQSNLEVTASLLINDDKEKVLTGETFQYILQYNTPNNASQYVGSKLVFTLPEHVELAKDSEGNFRIDGVEYDSIVETVLTNRVQYVVSLKSPLAMHATNTLTMVMKTRTIVTPDDLVLDFNKGFQFQTQIGEGAPPQYFQVKAGTVTTEAASNWEIKKENITDNATLNYVRVGDNFEVTYRVTVEDKNGVDNNGRLGFTAYQVVDTLPTIPAGVVNGEAIEVKDVKLIHRGTPESLVLGTDYSVTENADGKPVSITFNKHDTIRTTEESQYLQIGDVTNTTYEYTLVYPYAPYTTSGDEANVIEHTLENTATLNYTLVGGETGQKTSKAVVDIGEWEDNTPIADIKVKKYVKYSNGTEELLDAATAEKFGFTGNNKVKFTLYKDRACQEVAYNVGKEGSPRAQMSDMEVNANGEVTFPNIRMGTYYIKEVTQREGWEEAGVIEVVVNEDGTVTYPVGKDHFAVVNTATAFNAVEFTKTGVDVNGTESNGLAGVRFELSSGENKYYANSDANGKVRFDNIPDGTYTLKEYALIDSSLEDLGYVVSDKEFTIELQGGKVVSPVLDGNNTFENISPKGHLTIVKKDKTNGNKLAGATFEVYGPFANETEAESADLSLMNPQVTLTTVGTDGSITFGPLTEGIYVLKEVQAPANYVIDEETTLVEVTRHQTLSVEIDNVPQVKVFFHKKGADKLNGGPEQELYGTQFKLYDNSGNVLYGTKSGNATSGFNYTNVSTTQGSGQEEVILTTVSDGSNKAVSGYVQLPPGQYQYEEIAVPAPFTPESGRKTFTVNKVNQLNGNWVFDQMETVHNYLKNGQIRVEKTVSNKATPDASDVNGAEFGVYESYADAESGTNPIQVITTGTYMENEVPVNGIGYSTETLEIGKTYYVKEIKAPAGYAVNNTITEVTPRAEAPQVTVECTNDPTVSIKIIKVDSLDENIKLEGATFNLYKNETDTQPINATPVETDRDGVVVFGDLDPNTTYYYEEVTAPTGYIKLNGRHHVTTGTNGAQAEYTVSNTPLVRLEITKVDSTDSNKKLNGAQFNLYKDAAGTQKVNANPVTTANGVAVFTGLTPGETYYYQEVKAPTGYLVDNTIKSIEIGHNTALVEISVDNVPLVAIKIVKTDRSTGESLSGAVFELYESTDGSAVKTGTTTNGVLTFTDLVPGKTYYIKEKTAPTGYYITENGFIPVVAGTNGETVTVPVTNDPLTDITITKKDSKTDALLDGAVFKLYETKNGEAKQTATTQNGVVTFTGLMPGVTYYIKETTAPNNYVKVTTAPDGYEMDADGFIEFEAGEDTAITVKNDRKGTLKLHKTTGVSGQTATNFGGVTFRLFAAPEGSTAPDLTAKPLGTQTTANNGKASFQNLTPGDYWLVETVKENYEATTTPSGWDGITTYNGTQYFYKKVNVQVGENISGYNSDYTEEIHNTPTKGQLRIKKYAANANGGTGSTLDGVTFTIYSDAACENEVATITTKNGGVATSDYLAPGTYYVKETAVPANSDYILSDTVYTVVVEAGKTATTAKIGDATVSLEGIINEKSGDFTIQKKELYTITTVDKDGKVTTSTVNRPLAGATFTLYKSDVNKTQGEVVTTVTISSANAKYTFTDLEPGYYLLVETAAPSGYVKGPDKFIKVNADGSVEIETINDGTPDWSDVTGTVIINNKPNTKIQLTKKDAYNANEPLAGATFEVYIVDDENGNSFTIGDKTVSLRLIGTYTTDEEGSFEVPGTIASGTYYFKEITAPEDYTYNPNEVWRSVVVTENNEYIVQYVNYPEDVEGVKYGENRAALDGAVLALFDNKTDADNMISTLRTSYNGVTNNALTMDLINANKATWNIDQVVTSDGEGEFKFEDLTAGTTYYVVELIAPTDYQLDYTAHKFTVGASTKPFVEITDKKLHKIVLEKKYKLSNGTAEDLSGAVFTIYPDNNGTPAATPLTTVMTEVSDNPGRHESGPLPAGTYWLAETTFPTGYTVASRTDSSYYKDVGGVRYYKVVLTDSADNNYFETHPVYNVHPQGKFVLRKVSSKNENTEVEATFSVEKWNATTSKFETYTDIPSITTPANNSSANPKFTSDYMDPGVYKLTETGTEDGYTESAVTVYIKIEAGKITDGTNSQTMDLDKNGVTVYTPTDIIGNPIKVTNDPKGELWIYKTGSYNGTGKTPLNGVTFEVYEKTSTGRKLVGAYTTGGDYGDGYIKITGLDAGTYIVIETNIGDNTDYSLNSTEHEVTVAVGQVGSANNALRVDNDAVAGQFKVKKVDDVTGSPISDVIFQILNNDGTDTGKVMTHSGNGVYISDMLQPGTYKLKEIEVPDEYNNTNNLGADLSGKVLDGTYTVTADTVADYTNSPITNEQNKSLTITKYSYKDTDGDNVKDAGETVNAGTLSGAVFGLYTDSACENLFGEATTGPDGTATWSGLTYGTYYLKELTAPTGYTPDEIVHPIVITAANVNQQTFTYTRDMYNAEIGGVIIEKKICWENDTFIIGENVSFDLYAASSVVNGEVVEGATKITTLTTGSDGKTLVYRLAPGDYVLIEQSNPAYNAPEAEADSDNDGNYIDEHNYVRFRVVGSNINEVFTGDNAIENTANYGRFHFVKRAKTGNGADEWITLGGAQYELQKLNGTEWVPVNPDNSYITVLENGGYTSGLIEPGTYRVIERVAPNAPQGSDVEFIIDSEPVVFEVEAAKTAEAYQVDGIKRDLKIVKQADVKNGSVRLNGVTFEIYQAAEGFDAAAVIAYTGVGENAKETLLAQNAVDADPDLEGINPIDTQTTKNVNGEAGVAIFEKLTPGNYLLVETAAPDGYGLRALVVNVVPTDIYTEAMYAIAPIVNKSLQGRIRILKEDSLGNPIGGAVFKIYAKDDEVECDHTDCDHEVDTVEIGADGYGLSKLLDVGEYYVVEVKAPSGYTLDSNLTTLKKLVRVSGDQTPSVDFAAMDRDASSGYTDGVVFRNHAMNDIGGVNSNLDKMVRLVGATNFEGGYVRSDDSLMLTDVTAEFKITKLTSSEHRNELALAKFVVTDDSLEFLGLKNYNQDMDSYDPNEDFEKELVAVENPTSDDYVMNYIKIGRAYNTDETKLVSAKVYAKVGNKNAEWEEVAELTDVSSITESAMVELPEDAVGFKVEYSNAGVGFQAGDIDVEVTFKKRTSNADIPQVLVVKNTAMLEWEDTRLDEFGQPAHQSGNPSDTAKVVFKPYETKMPELELKHDIINRPLNDLYYSGGTVDLVTVGGVPAGSPAELEHPVMSINLPPYTTLDTAKYSELEGGINGIRATITSETSDRNGNILQFSVVRVDPVLGENEDDYEKYVLDFGPDFELKPGESIKLEYTANISLDVPDNKITLYSYGLIGSAKQLPMTSENKTGMSYQKAAADSSNIITDDGFDNGLIALDNTIAGGDLTYLHRPADIELARADSRLIRKYVSVDKETWHMTEIPTVKPGDNYYYKLVLVNGGDAAERARIIDIMPFDGDTQEFRAMSGGSIMARQTNLPYGEITTDENKNLVYEQVQLVAVEAQEKANTKVTVYYYVEDDNVTENVMNRDWTAANRGLKTAVEELPMLTSNKDAEDVWTGNWTTVCPADMRTVTAIGIEVEYLNGTCLDTGDSYEVTLTMRAPGYTAEQMYQYQTWENEDVLIANTTAGVVTKVGADADDPVQVVDRVSSNEVFTKLYITTGSIGDYAFYDNNDNGIQDEGDIPARNIPVTLYRRKVTTATVGEPQWEVYKETYTDQTTGEYLFDELPCNYLAPGKTEGSKDPADYIGNTYYEYLVQFGIPEGYSATIREAGNDRAVDSNINEEGLAGATFVEVEEDGQKKMVAVPITLTLTLDAEGKLQGEINPTIDAGYVKLVNLGDYVWVDYNKNGVQDESEPGVNGATVNLYKLESAEDTIIGKEPYRTQLTDTKDGHDGYYCFTDLPKGYYVVEFDITTVNKQTGYTEKYAFTVNDAGSNGADSDAKFEKNNNDQVMYTEVIHLTEDDMTWDAGLTVYSALGGFVFDDQDYNDTQSIPTEVDEETTANGIPLPGTVVTLYEVREDGSMNPEPIGQQTVGEDGRYFFDHLEAGRYKVHFDYPDRYIGVKDGVGDYLHDSETKFFDDSTLNSGFTDIIELPVDTADLTHDAGAYLVSSIGDYVWEDLDRDGIQDEDEAPVKDITVTLQQKLGDGEWTTIETTVTDKNGLYLFEGLKSSDHYDVQYRVAFAIPLTVELTGDNIGENRAVDSNALPELDVEYGYFTNNVKPPYGEDDLTIDAGLYYKDGLCEVGDYVWYDDDKDGVQDKDEKGVEGIVVVLEKCTSDDIRDEDAWVFVAKTETDENGKYIFKGLEAGRYRIAFGLGEPWIVTVSRVGDAALDSDAIRQVEDYYYTSAFFLNVGDSDMTWDAGIYKPTIIVVPPTTEPTEPPTEPTEPPTEPTEPPTEPTEPPTEPTEPPTEPTEPPTEPTEPDPIIPSTGDNFNMAIWMAIMLSSMTMLAILLKKVTK